MARVRWVPCRFPVVSHVHLAIVNGIPERWYKRMIRTRLALILPHKTQHTNKINTMYTTYHLQAHNNNNEGNGLFVLLKRTALVSPTSAAQSRLVLSRARAVP